MTQMIAAYSLLVGIVGLLWVLALTIVHSNRGMHNKKTRIF